LIGRIVEVVETVEIIEVVLFRRQRTARIKLMALD